MGGSLTRLIGVRLAIDRRIVQDRESRRRDLEHSVEDPYR
jgi:hypothetical protein